MYIKHCTNFIFCFINFICFFLLLYMLISWYVYEQKKKLTVDSIIGLMNVRAIFAIFAVVGSDALWM